MYVPCTRGIEIKQKNAVSSTLGVSTRGVSICAWASEIVHFWRSRTNIGCDLVNTSEQCPITQFLARAWYYNRLYADYARFASYDFTRKVACTTIDRNEYRIGDFLANRSRTIASQGASYSPRLSRRKAPGAIGITEWRIYHHDILSRFYRGFIEVQNEKTNILFKEILGFFYFHAYIHFMHCAWFSSTSLTNEARVFIRFLYDLLNRM